MKRPVKPQTTREQLVEALTPLLPKAWKVVPYSRNLDALSAPTVMVHLSNITRAPAAPQGALLSEFTVSVLDPQTDPERAQGALDDEVMDLIHAIDDLPGWIVWDSAEPTLVGDYLAWDLKTTVVSRKDA